MKCPVCPGRVNHPKGLKGEGEGFCPRQKEIKELLDKKYLSGGPGSSCGPTDRPEAKKDKIYNRLKAQANSAKPSVAVEGANFLGMFWKGKCNVAIMHTA